VDQFPVAYDITLTRSASWLETFYCLADDGASALIDGCTAVLQIRNAYDGSLIVEFSTANNLLTMDVDVGSIAGSTLPEDLADLTSVPAVYALIVTFPNGQAFEWFAGAAKIRLGVVQ
jgi:hypothetical protein